MTSFSPTHGLYGDAVAVNGTGFTGATVVRFNGTAVSSFVVVSDILITTTVPSGSSTGHVSVTGPGGTGTSVGNFTIDFVPVVTSYSVNHAFHGATIHVFGSHFTGETGGTFAAPFGGRVAATIVFNSDGDVSATVPSTAVSGTFQLTTPGGTGTGPLFTIDDFIIDMSQPTAPPGLVVTRTGAPMYLRTSENAVRLVGANVADAYENFGVSGGRWALGPIVNEVASPFDFASMVQQPNAHVQVNSVDGPDGVGGQKATLVTDRSPDDVIPLISPGSIVHSTPDSIYASVWTRNIAGKITPTVVSSFFTDAISGFGEQLAASGERGNEFTVATAVKLVAMSIVRYADDTVSSRTLSLWDSASMTLITSVATSEAGAPPGRLVALLGSPVMLTPGTNYIVTSGFPASVGFRGASLPHAGSNSNVTVVAGRYSFVSGVFPDGVLAANEYQVDIVGIDPGADLDAPPTTAGGIDGFGRITGPEQTAFAVAFPIAADAMWRRSVMSLSAQIYGPLTGSFCAYPAGVNPAPAQEPVNQFDLGGYHFWGAQLQGSVADAPLVLGSTGKIDNDIASGYMPAVLDSNGDLHVVFNFLTDNQVAVANIADQQFAFYASVPEGDFFVTYGLVTEFTPTMRGTSLGALNPNNLPVNSEVRLEFAYKPNTTGKYRFQIWVNGARSGGAGGFFDGNTFGGISAPTAIRLGKDSSNARSLNHRMTLMSSAQAIGRTSVDTAEWVILGDSQLNYTALLTVPQLIYTVAESRTRPGIVSYATPGETTTQQRAHWEGSAQFGLAGITAVIDQSGINDIGSLTAAQVLTSMQQTITDANASSPTAKVFRYQLMPGADALAHPAVFVAVNLGISGGGPNALTGSNLNACRTRAWPAFNNGSGGLAAWADSGDGQHENDPARIYLGQVWRADQQAAGNLPGGAAPTFGAFSPSSGAVGSTVVITGCTGATPVTGVLFNGTPAVALIPISDTEVHAVVPPGATTGNITLQTPLGSVVSGSIFTVP